MHKLIFCCLIIVSFSFPLSSLPIINTSEMSYQLSADEDSRFNLERLGSPGSTSLIQFLPELLGTLTEDSKAGEDLPQQRESAHSLHLQLPQMLCPDSWRNQYKKRGNLSECFWKYCV
ncbi:UTS2 protein, partial [Neodrepanis coruscans]|nr:UTS2 protein [Neodrepanis coruscans]